MRSAVLMAFALVAFAAPAQAGFWEWVTGGPKDTDPNPAQTLIAPFADIRGQQDESTA